MKKYRIISNENCFRIQKKFLFLWKNVQLYDRVGKRPLNFSSKKDAQDHIEKIIRDEINLKQSRIWRVV